MESLVIKPDTKAQEQALKAFAKALNLKIQKLEKAEDEIFEKMVHEGYKKDRLTPKQQEEFFNLLGK